jgi:REP element-mobilizing transposase RayT/DNA-binding protein Fis
MTRPLRVHLRDGFYHVTLRGNHQQPIFLIDGDRQRLNRIVSDAMDRYTAKLHAYCWMTNHLHFLIQVSEHPLGLVMRQIASQYARAFQRKLQTTGHLFERRYYARVVDVEAYLLLLLRYIHLNPVVAGLVKVAGHYPWSSYHVYAGTKTEPWVTTDFALRMFGSPRSQAIAAYLRFLNCDLEDVVYPIDEPPPSLPPVRDRGQPNANSRANRKCTQSLAELIEESCRRFGTTSERLHSESRDPYLMQVRAWISRRALEQGIANLSEISRVLGRDRATLRHAMRRYPRELE